MPYHSTSWSSYNPVYSSLLLYQDKYGATDRPFGKQADPYMTATGDRHYSVRDPEYWRRYRERRALGFPESAVATRYQADKSVVPSYKYYNSFDHYYPSYGARYHSRSYNWPAYRYPYWSSHSYDYPYSRYGYYSNWRRYDADLLPYSTSAGRWAYDFPGYTRHLGSTAVVKRVPQAFRLDVDGAISGRASSVPSRLEALGPSVPLSQVHALDLEVLPARIDANLAPPRSRRLLESLNIGADDLEWIADGRRPL